MRSGSSPAFAASRRTMRNAPARVRAPPWALRKSSGRCRLSRYGPTPAQIAAQCLHRLAPERDDALLVSLPHAPDGAVLQVDAAALEPDRLAHAEAASVQELDEGPVAHAAGGRAVGRVDQALDLAEGEGAGKPLPPPRQVDVRGRVVAPLAERDQMAVEGTGGGGTARDRARRLAPPAQVGEPALDVVRPCGRRRTSQVARQVGEVAPVRVDRSWRPARGEQGEKAFHGRIGHVRGLTPDMAVRVRRAGGHGRRPS